MKRTSVIIVLLVLLIAGGAISAPRNIILLIGDGMGLAHVAGARLASHGGTGGRLTLDSMPVTGIVTTYSANSMITDSAAAGTALATGTKTNNYTIAQSPDGARLKTLLERAQDMLKSTGIVTTTSITDATPAVFGSHVANRGMQPEIASQLISAHIDVIMGGGKAFFLPKDTEGSQREDSRDLLIEAKSAGYTFCSTSDELRVAKGKILCLPALTELDAGVPAPPLSELAAKAIDVLSKDKQGFFLMCEGGLIDRYAHANNFDGMVAQLMEFDKVVAKALEFAKKDGNTLVVVTADHETGGLTLLTDEHGKLRPSWSTSGHSGIPVPVYAYGPGSECFAGFQDNTELSKKLANFIMSGKHMKLTGAETSLTK